MSKWDELTMAEKAEMIGVAVRNGITNLQDIRDKYNEFAEGGSKEGGEEVNTIMPFTQRAEVVITPDAEYNQYLNTLPDNQRFTPNDAYDSYLYWKLNGKPRNFREAYDKGMFTWDSSDNSYHANSIAFGDDGVGYFMKPKTHDTVGFETDWYNKGLVTEEGGTQRPMTPEEKAEWLDFRNQYNLIDDPDRPNYYRYEPKSKHSLGGPLVEAAMNEYRNGGSIHIKPSHRGRLTELKKRTGKTEAELYNDGNPAHKKMVVFARNSRRWKHGLGGNLYGDGGILDWLKELFSFGNEEKALEPVYRNRPAEKIIIANNGKRYTAYAPKRVSENNSKTKEQSEKLENSMRATIRMDQARNRSNPDYDIPYIPEKSIIINGSTTSTNVLDSLAKYAGEHNRNPQLSQKTIRKRDSYTAPRKISMDEMLGLSTQETKNGAMPYFNFKKGQPSYNRALANSNYLTAFGSIPAEYLVRNYQYNDANIDRNTPPLLDAFRYYAQGDYNSNDHNHKSDVIAAGKEAWNNPKVKEWWETSGKYWYNNEKK